MNEIEKMRNGELADMSKPEIQESFIHTKNCLRDCIGRYLQNEWR